MEIFLGILFGLITGTLARTIMPGPRFGGLPVGAALGMAGALAGVAIGAATTTWNHTGFDVHTFLMAVFGAVALLFCYRCYAMRGSDDLVA
jgi:uncharacterized membrane protein YeaQ/YmgE (transglycosylase-associated protein family)